MKKLVVLLPFILVFLATFTQPWDLDLGWHLRFGKDVVENHIFSYTNTYSLELPGYHWFNSSWGLDVIKYIVFSKTGFIGYALLGSITVLLMFYVLKKTYNLNLLDMTILFPLLLYLEDPILNQSFKNQTLSFLFIVILYYILWQFKKGNEKSIYLLIPFFFVWANLHAQFIVGLGIFVLWSIIYLLLNIHKDIKKHTLILGLTLGCSLLVTLVNPYGINLYKDSLFHVNSPPLQYVEEFDSPILWSITWWNLIFCGSLLLLSIITILRKKSIKDYLPFITVSIALFILSFVSKRYIWSMYLVTLPCIIVLVKSIPFPKKIQGTIATALLLASILYLLALQLPQRNLTNLSWESYCKIEVINMCSPKAADALVNMKNRGKLFSHYNYGGWLIWNYQDVKPAIDGRMPQWTDESGYSPFRRFVVTSNLNQYQLENYPYDTYFIPSDSPLKEELNRLSDRSKKWKNVYEDNIITIFSRMAQ